MSGSVRGPTLTGTERAVFGSGSYAGLRAFLSGWTHDRLGGRIADVLFRSGRVDVVWGVRLDDGRSVVVKIHRPPADLETLEVTHDALRVLAAAGYPCAEPLVPPAIEDGRVVTAEPLIVGEVPDGHDPVNRRLLADGLARHVEILRGHRDLVGRAGRGPSWCRYADGPWPVPHDTLVDFSSTPPDFAWLDDLGRRAADQILAHRDPDAVVVGHADWYAGNTAVACSPEPRLVGTFDWELVADTEAVVAGFAAACFAASSTGSAGLSSPGEVAAFLQDYDTARGRTSSAGEQRTAAGAAAWIIAFNARWQVGLMEHGLDDQAVLARARDDGAAYLSLTW